MTLPRLGRRATLVAALAVAAAVPPARWPAAPDPWAAWPHVRRPRPARPPTLRLGPAAEPPAAAGGAPPYLPWRAVLARVAAGGPNGRLGLVQGHHIFGRGGGFRLMRNGLVRVRIPAQMIAQGDDAWARTRFEDAWWMAVLRRLDVPVKAVVELARRATDEQHALHAARLVRYGNPNVVIVGNELNLIEHRAGVDVAEEIERYLNRYAAIHAAVRAEAPETHLQLYGEAYDGEPGDAGAFLRRVLAGLRRRGLPPPDLAGVHVYDRAEAVPARVAGYRRLLADFDLQVPLSVEELGPRQGVIDRWEQNVLAARPADDAARYPHRLAELQARGWLTEAEHAELVAQHLAAAAAVADQAQIFCAIDFEAELHQRRGLVSGDYGRARPALDAFTFLQRLLNEPEAIRLIPAVERGGIATVDVVRRDGLAAQVHWSAPVDGEDVAPARALPVPPFTWVCDACGQLVAAPRARAHTLELPAATTAEAGGAVRIFL